MARKSIIPLAFLAALTASGVDAKDAAPAGRRMVLFGASWCAPCRGELRDLRALAAAAAPDRLDVAWIDRAPPAGTASVGGNVSVVPPAEARRQFENVAGANQGLPVTALFDTQGRLCGMLRAPATVAAIRKLRADC